MNERLIFVELNEINLDAVDLYLKRGHVLNGFKKILDNGLITTRSEKEYENLEPWIQWVSVHTGKKFSEHQVFRLGDFINSSQRQFFEKVEDEGYSVGAVSPMNASNKLKDPTYFIPDPWTKTPSDRSYLSKTVSNAITQAVNDNSEEKLTLKTIINLGIAFIFLVNPKRYFSLIAYALKALRKPWRKALFLDKLLYEIHKSLFKRKKPDFSTLFLNAGAHIQHHYFFNSLLNESSNIENPSWYISKNEDPFLEMLKVYDEILSEVLNIEDAEIIIATGLSQKPYEKIKFYYRLKNHSAFLNMLKIPFKEVFPRMTRDFLISFDSSLQAQEAEKKLSKILVNNKDRLFEEIDNRGKDVFVVLTYPSEIDENTTISFSDKSLLLNKLVSFVAIKNGEHQDKGFAYFTKGISKYAPPEDSHVSKIHQTVLDFFGVSS